MTPHRPRWPVSRWLAKVGQWDESASDATRGLQWPTVRFSTYVNCNGSFPLGDKRLRRGEPSRYMALFLSCRIFIFDCKPPAHDNFRQHSCDTPPGPKFRSHVDCRCPYGWPPGLVRHLSPGDLVRRDADRLSPDPLVPDDASSGTLGTRDPTGRPQPEPRAESGCHRNRMALGD